MAERQTVLSGSPLLAKIGGLIALAFGVLSLAGWPDPLALGATIVGLLVAWRLLQLALFIDGDDLVIRNLFSTERLPVGRAIVRQTTTDMRHRNATGMRLLPENSVPKLSDDNTKTHSTIIRIADKNNPKKSLHVDCSIGVLPATQHRLYEKIRIELGE